MVGMAGGGMMSLTEASRLLGVGSEQVRRYVRRGLLPAAKIANAWLLPAADVHALASCPPRAGRPLSQTAAWRSIFAASVMFDDPNRYANRGALSRHTGGAGMIAALLARSDVVVSGMHAASVYVDMLDPLADAAQIYVEEGLAARSGNNHPIHAMAADPLGRVLVRAVRPEAWHNLRAHCTPAGETHATLPVSSLCAPGAAVALDLCNSPHPREQRVAGAIIENLP